MTTNGSVKKFGLDVIIRFITQSFLKLKGIIFLPVIAKHLGSEDYGIWTQISITLLLLTPVLMLRTETAVIRFFSSLKDKKLSSTLFFLLFILICFFLTLVCGVSFFFKEKIAFLLLADSKLTNYIAVLCLLLAVHVSYEFLLNYYRAFSRIKLYSFIQLITTFIQLLIVILVVLFTRYGLIGALISMIVTEGIAAILISFKILSETGIYFRFPLKKYLFDYILPYLKFSLPLIPNGILFWVINMSDRYMIVHLLNIKSAGIYSASYNLAGMIMFFATPISFTLFPHISALWEQKETGKVRKYIEKSVEYFLMVSLPALICVIYFSPYLLKLLATDDFITSRFLVFFIGVGYCLVGVYQITIFIVPLRKKNHILIVFFALSASVNIVLNLFLIPVYNIEGAAVATFISYFILFITALSIAKRWLNIKLNYYKSFKFLTASLCMCCLYIIFRPEKVLFMIASVILSLGIYLFIIWVSGCFDENEINLIKKYCFFLKTNNKKV